MTEWRLANGIRVWVKPTGFQNDQVLMSAFSLGGLSLVADDVFVPAETATAIIGQSGLGAFDQTALRKKLAGKLVSITPTLAENWEGLRGTASPQDLETLLQLAHLLFTAPRVDPDAFVALQTRMRDFVRNRRNDPEAVFADEMTRALYGDHPRHQPTTLATIEAMDAGASLRVFRERFADAGSFTFLFVGNLELDSLQPLVERYLGSLPALDRAETPRFNDDAPARGRLEVTVHQGLEPKSLVELLFTGEADWSYDAMQHLRAAVEVLRIRLRETLREDQGGTYGVGVDGTLERLPRGAYRCGIRFGCAPDRVSELIRLALDEVRGLQAEGPTAENLAKVKEMQLRAFELGMKENPFWLGNLVFRARNGLDPEAMLEFPERVQALDPDAVQAAANRYFAFDNLLIGKLYPANR